MLREKFALTEKGIREFKRGVVFCVLANITLMLPVGVLFLLVSEFMAHLIDPSVPLPGLTKYLLITAGVLLLMALTQWGEYANTYNVVYGESARKRVELAEKLRRLPLSFFGRRDLSDLTTTIMKDTTDQERMFSHVMPQLFGTGISTAVIALSLFAFDWRLAIASLWVVPVALLLVVGSAKVQQNYGRKLTDSQLGVADGIQEYLECIREIHATNQVEGFLKTLRGQIRHTEKAHMAAEIVPGVFITSAQAFLKLGIATTVLVGVSLLVTGQVDFMVYFAFLLVVTRVYDPINTVLASIIELLNLRLGIRRMQVIEAEEIQTGTTTFAPSNHNLKFDRVSFSYRDAEQVLDNVNFTACEGEVTALVGPSGGGKSTVAKLAARFWDADSGTVSVGGTDVSTVEPETLLKEYAEVFQDVVLFDDTVMGNIRLGRMDATDEEILSAAKAANCDEFATRLAQGYDTMIGENGSRLSGGERQRISIARALLKNAPIVLLDEATASLDVENETQVQGALSRLLADKTVLVIAHRMRTIASADKIVVLREGVVVEQGSPADLIKRKGVYHHMVELQSAADKWTV